MDDLLDSPTEKRAARVVELSRGDPARQRELEQLLAEAERGAPLLERSAARRFDELATDAGDASLPEVLGGRYRRGRELGRGGMATVYLARDEKHGRDVAIKVIKSDLSASLGHDRFLREIEIAARLRHPNIVPLYDSGEANGSLFFVMPYESGQSLRERLRDGGALPIADALSVLRDVARALAHAHEHGVVHRDIKPDNVMLSGDAAVVTDFGIAKAVSVALADAPDATLTVAGTVIGTPAYMAPEQATGDASIDHRADVYSFGCLAYELFAGHPPFQEKTSHLLIAAHIATIPRPIAELRSDVPSPVAELLARCLAKAPPDRPQTARELLPLLDGAGRIVVSSPPPVAQRKARRWSRARISSAVAIAAGVAALVGYVAVRTATAAPITVAVLPFGNIAGDSAMEFIGEGLADEVASALARVPGILIKSRNGALRYRGQLGTDVTEAGARLKADYLVTAVMRQDKGLWVLTADFSRAADASSLWTEKFVLNPNEQTAAADTLTGQLAATLRRLFPRAIGVVPVRLPSGKTSNTQAYAFYLKGQGALAHRGRSVKDAIEAFQQAIREDSLFAPGYAGLSMALALAPWFERVRSQDVRDDVGAAARQALRLDSTLSPPHVALGVANWQAYDWIGAAAEFKTAIRLDPRNVEARVQYGRVLRISGQYAEALTQLQAARSVDPASALVLSHITGVYIASGQLDSAIATGNLALAMDPTNLTTLMYSGLAYLRSNRPQEARKIWNHLGKDAFETEQLRAAGDVEGLRQMLRRLDAEPRRDYGKLIPVYLALGDTANALSALERATEPSGLWAQSTDFLSDSAYDPIRGSARYRAILKRIGLTDYLSSLGR